MTEVTVRTDEVFSLFRDVIGGADIDDIYEAYGHFNLNNFNDRKEFIKACISDSLLNIDSKQIDNVKLSLSYFTFKDDSFIREKVDSYLFPFEFPDDLHQFLVEIWQALFKDDAPCLAGLTFKVV